MYRMTKGKDGVAARKLLFVLLSMRFSQTPSPPLFVFFPFSFFLHCVPVRSHPDFLFMTNVDGRAAEWRLWHSGILTGPG